MTEELARLGRELVVEPPALSEDIVGASRGTGVAGSELQRGVREGEGIVLAEPLRLRALDGIRDGYEILHDGGAELLHVRLGVAVPAHAAVAEGGVALVAHLFAHRVAQMHELVIDRIELLLIVLVPFAVGFPCREAAGVVGVGHEGSELGERVNPALEGDLRGGEELGIFGRERVLLLHLGDNIGGEGLERDLGVYEHEAAELLLELLPERAL